VGLPFFRLPTWSNEDAAVARHRTKYLPFGVNDADGDDIEVADLRVNQAGKPGRKNSTSDIAAFALARRRERKSWKEIFHEWRAAFPKDTRVRRPSDIREAYRRHFGDKAKARSQRTLNSPTEVRSSHHG
jgi:hypothetical protein